jgi:hypothetical protein
MFIYLSIYGMCKGSALATRQGTRSPAPLIAKSGSREASPPWQEFEDSVLIVLD